MAQVGVGKVEVFRNDDVRRKWPDRNELPVGPSATIHRVDVLVGVGVGVVAVDVAVGDVFE